MLAVRVGKNENGANRLESKRFGTITERTPLPIASPTPCLELFLSNNRLNNRMKGNVTRLHVSFLATVTEKRDTEQ